MASAVPAWVWWVGGIGAVGLVVAVARTADARAVPPSQVDPLTGRLLVGGATGGLPHPSSPEATNPTPAPAARWPAVSASTPQTAATIASWPGSSSHPSAGVAILQRQLAARGYVPGNPDGVYGAGTHAATLAFLAANRAPHEPFTLAEARSNPVGTDLLPLVERLYRLGSGTNLLQTAATLNGPFPGTAGSPSPGVRVLQAQLRRLGRPPSGAQDGVYDAPTHAAADAFLTSRDGPIGVSVVDVRADRDLGRGVLTRVNNYMTAVG